MAESVPTDAEAVALRELGCRYGQGYLWGEALPAAGIGAFRPREGPDGG